MTAMPAFEMTTRNDLAWLANCYVAGELSADEAAAFEVRLETDVAACGAVAQAMELNLAIAAAFDAEPSTLNPQPSTIPPTRRAVAAVAALTVAALAVAGIAVMVSRGPDGNAVARKDGVDTLVAAWASGEAARNATDDDESLDAHDDADLDPPDWLLMALTPDEA